MFLVGFFQEVKREGGGGGLGECRRPLKLDILFWEIVVGTFKWGGHLKKKFFINNSVEAIIWFKEKYQGLLNLHGLLEGGWISSVVKHSGEWANVLKQTLIHKLQHLI